MYRIYSRFFYYYFFCSANAGSYWYRFAQDLALIEFYDLFYRKVAASLLGLHMYSRGLPTILIEFMLENTYLLYFFVISVPRITCIPDLIRFGTFPITYLRG